MTEETLLDARTINEVLKFLNQPIGNATEACALVRRLAIAGGLPLVDPKDQDISGGDFSPWFKGEGARKRAIRAVDDYENWCHQNEAEFSGWGDGIIPDKAIVFTKKAKVAKALIEGKDIEIFVSDAMGAEVAALREELRISKNYEKLWRDKCNEQSEIIKRGYVDATTDKAKRLEAEIAELRKNVPLTSAALADALDAFWNAAIGHGHREQSTTLAMDTIGAIAEGFGAVAGELRKAGA